MQTTLHFGDMDEFSAQCAVHSMEFWGVIEDIDDRCRSRLKYGDGLTDQEEQILEEIRDLCSVKNKIEERC